MYVVRYKSHHAALMKLKKVFEEKQNPALYLKEMLNTSSDNSRSIYIHVPYCMKLCSFCNLNRTKIDSSIENYHELILKQIRNVAKYNYIRSKEFESIYFGGGTPTTLSAKQIEIILKALYELLPISRNAEVSFETSVSELTEDRLNIMKELGVNRFSIGVQTFVDRGRRLLGRRGSGILAIKKIQEVLDKGFENTNIDLIYNYPGQTLDELMYDLKIVKDLNIAGLSYYSLIMHEGSLLFKLINDGVVSPPKIEKDKFFFNIICDELNNNGFELLELTKLARKNRDKYQYIRVKYKAGDCLAFGNGAGGKLKNYLYYNVPMPFHLRQDHEFPLPLTGTVVNKYYDIGIKIIGEIQFGYISFDQMDEENNVKFRFYCKDLIDKYVENGLLDELDNGLYKLTREGIFWGNNICSDIAERFAEFFINEVKEKGCIM
ncbi:radical SAM protein [Thermosipho ferrireducens]|uniref:Radical SAM protein n=1 Tax=Thermosipho ferrireducens TaxID=2571116 RepID=A0ABX7S7E4_9BACT|nr:coproporphyrinogen-III oxidase family protein [Thermosipho ferrireducens]QTA37532.1 radical SAM protein [Thermosipho ferrireducens]